jgi:hypothetical protein
MNKAVQGTARRPVELSKWNDGKSNGRSGQRRSGWKTLGSGENFRLLGLYVGSLWKVSLFPVCRTNFHNL